MVSSSSSSSSSSLELPTPRKVVTYPLGSEANAGAVFFFGDADAPNIALCCAGFPDDHDHFLPFASRLASEANCLVGVTCLPGYDNREDYPFDTTITINKPNGYTFDEWAIAMKESVKCLKAESTFTGPGDAKFTDIFHDWGVSAGILYTNRILEEGNNELTPNQIVFFDVLGAPHPKTENIPVVPKDSLREKAITILYRISFASSFWIRRYISMPLAAVNLIFTITILRVLGLNPTFAIDSQYIRQRKNPISLDRMIYMMYPYYHMFKGMITGTLKKKQWSGGGGGGLPLDLKKTPVLYMYGVHKNIQFHDKSSLKLLEKEETEEEKSRGGRSKVVAVEDAGHYLYLQQPDICIEEVKKFIEDA